MGGKKCYLYHDTKLTEHRIPKNFSVRHVIVELSLQQKRRFLGEFSQKTKLFLSTEILLLVGNGLPFPVYVTSLFFSCPLLRCPLNARLESCREMMHD